MKTDNRQEPNFAKACEWWSDLPNIWTPIGWKDHMFCFNVFWNGTILAKPDLNRRTEQWKGQGAQFSFVPVTKSTDITPISPTNSLRFDDGMVRQGWNDGPAPVLWSEWPWTGALFRQEVFAHIPGGGDTRTGDEPLFAWVRLSIADFISALPVQDSPAFRIFIQAPNIEKGMEIRQFKLNEEIALYPRPLLPDDVKYNRRKGLRILEEDGKVRLGVAAGQPCHTMFTPPCGRSAPSSKYSLLDIYLPLRKGAHADVLLPILPTERNVFDREFAQGYDTALREARRYWARRPGTAASITVPEPFINEAVKHSIRFSQVIAEKNPATGKYCKRTGSWMYADLWATPMAMESIMLMDTLGYHDVTSRYLDIFRDEQGTVVPPGTAYRKHPGYLSTPALCKAVDWLSDNGGILYMLSMHGLLSNDRRFIAEFTGTIVKSCEWIKESRALKGHGGYEGILPAAVATDNATKIQALWNDGWNYKGLCTAVRLLKRIKHPRAAEFEREAREYRTAFLGALRDKCQKTTTWRNARGQPHRLVPTALSGDQPGETLHAFYLDTGPLFLVFAGLMSANDPPMRDTLAWFREGPQRKFHRHDSLFWQTPVLDHEVSSCEPGYSWNVFHSWQLGDRAKFLEGMYSLFAGALSRKTCISCETRGGMSGLACTASLPIYLTRLAVVDDQIREDELHLLRLMPLAWLQPGATARFEKIPTEFGPISLRTDMSSDGRTLNVDFRPAFRMEPKNVVLHIPPVDGLKMLRLNGKTMAVRRKSVIIFQRNRLKEKA